MGSCTTRHYLLSICLLQLLSIIERNIFDFIGYMWAPILANFFQIIFVIFGFFGGYQFSAKYLITYTIWTLVWIAWNIFLICFYLNVGGLNRDSDVLNLGTGSVSWFEANGPGCIPTYPTNITSEDPYRLVRPESVEGCLLEYQTIEVIHSSVQLVLAIFGLIGSLCLAQVFFDDDDRFDFMGGDAKCVQHKIVLPMYVSIPTSTANTTMKSTKLLTNPYLDVTTTNSTRAATYNPEKQSINEHNQTLTNNQNSINNIKRNKSRYNPNDGINTNTNMNATLNVSNDNIQMSEHNATNNFSMSYNPYISDVRNEYLCNSIEKKFMKNPVRSHNADHVKMQYNRNDIVYRDSNKLCLIGPGYDTRSSSIDYNFNYVKYRSPLNATFKASNYRDSSTTSTLATDCSLFGRPSHKNIDDEEKRKSFVSSKVHNHPNCQCGIQNFCPFVNEMFDNHLKHQRSQADSCSIQDMKCFVRRYPYRNRDLNTCNAHNYDHKMDESPPEYDQVDDHPIKRTFSHDRLFCPRRILTTRYRTRPKSYCSNVSYCPKQL